MLGSEFQFQREAGGGEKESSAMSTTPEEDAFFLKFLLTITAAAVAETVTFPLDITKTRLQIQGQFGNGGLPYRGTFKMAIGIVGEEGLLNLWKGLTPAVLRHVVFSGCRLQVYEFIRERVFKRSQHGNYPLWKAIPGGMIAGAMGQYLASPTDLVKVRLQMEGRRMLEGKKPRHVGTWDGFHSIVKSEGVLGLWKGWEPNCLRAAFACLGDLTTYDATKQAILRNTSLEDNAVTHALSSTCSGLVAASVSTPFDVIKTRMMNQPYQNGRGLHYASTLDCLVTTVRAEGFWALYKGFFPIWARLAPWTLTFWLVYEELRVLAGVGNF